MRHTSGRIFNGWFGFFILSVDFVHMFAQTPSHAC